jgi:hypothetical protein
MLHYFPFTTYQLLPDSKTDGSRLFPASRLWTLAIDSRLLPTLDWLPITASRLCERQKPFPRARSLRSLKPQSSLRKASTSEFQTSLAPYLFLLFSAPLRLCERMLLPSNDSLRLPTLDSGLTTPDSVLNPTTPLAR